MPNPLQLIMVLAGLAITTVLHAQPRDVRTVGLAGDGQTDDTAALQAALDQGQVELTFPAGRYLLGTVNLPANTQLTFSPEAEIVIQPEGITQTVEVEHNGKTRRRSEKTPLFNVVGNRVRLSGLRFDFSSGGTDRDSTPLKVLVQADQVEDVVISDFTVRASAEQRKRKDLCVILMANTSRNLVLEDSSATDISDMVMAYGCANLTVRGNRMVGGNTMTTFSQGSESLNHHGNWSSQVGYQVVWRGGSPDPSRKAPRVPLGSADKVYRGLNEGDEGWHLHTQGVFDVHVQNNYAEYGTVLCWGNKGRQVLIEGNIARFMWDYSYGAEGGENHIFANNISINSAVAGIMSMYWGEKMLITGNLVVVRHEPFREERAGRTEAMYFGQFCRLHHGPPNAEDRYGAGSVLIADNLFVNELATRPSGISVEGGRDVLISGNKIINGMIRKHDELARIKLDAKDSDEFESQKSTTDDGQPFRLERRVTADQSSRLTVMDNEFISRLPGDKPVIVVNGTISSAIIKGNVLRKEASTARVTAEQKALEQSKPPRYMLYSVDNFDNRDLTNSTPTCAIQVKADTPLSSIIQDNIIMGWAQAIDAVNLLPDQPSTFLIRGNITDGETTVTGESANTKQHVQDNTKLGK